MDLFLRKPGTSAPALAIENAASRGGSKAVMEGKAAFGFFAGEREPSSLEECSGASACWVEAEIPPGGRYGGGPGRGGRR